jgi:hypothetical protein
VPPRGFTPGIDVDPPGKMFPKLGSRKNPLEPEVFIKGNYPQFEKLPPRGVPPGKGVQTHGNFKPPDILLPPA